jgi:hypothetical protein
MQDHVRDVDGGGTCFFKLMLQLKEPIFNLVLNVLWKLLFCCNQVWIERVLINLCIQNSSLASTAELAFIKLPFSRAKRLVSFTVEHGSGTYFVGQMYAPTSLLATGYTRVVALMPVRQYFSPNTTSLG